MYIDNDGEFKNKVMENYLEENNIDHITRGPYNPQYQGSVEVFNKTILDSFDINEGSSRIIFLFS